MANNVLFVGSFVSKSKTGHVGGQMYACNSLINSSLKKGYNFILLDTTASTNQKRRIWERGFSGLRRMTMFIRFLLFRRIDTVLIFCSSGFSFKEKGAMIRIAKAFGKKTILAPRSGFLIDDILSSNNFKHYAKKVFNSTDHIICQGHFWKEFFFQQFSLSYDKMHVIHNWIVPKEYVKNTKPEAKIQILFLGWVEKNKGIYDILECAKILKNENIEWIIGGNGKAFDDVQQKIYDSGLEDKMILKGWVLKKEKDELLGSSDIFVLPSYREGLPNALLEAMQAGLAVVTTNVGGIPDVIQDGVNGYLIKPGDHEMMAQKIKDLIKNRAKLISFGNIAQRTIQQQHTLEVAVSKLKEILL